MTNAALENFANIDAAFAINTLDRKAAAKDYYTKTFNDILKEMCP